MAEICTDNRFEIINKAKQDLLNATNIDTSPDEMKVIDSFLFRCWQMGWLDQYGTNATDTNVGSKQTNADRIRTMSDEEIAEKIINTNEPPAFTIQFCKNSWRCDDILDSGELVPKEMCKQCVIEWLQAESEG